MSPRALILYKKVKLKAEKYLIGDYIVNYWKRNKKAVLKDRFSGYLIKLTDLGLSTEHYEKIRTLQMESDEVIIAEIDQDGSLLSRFGTIKNLPMVSDRDFLKRKRFAITLISKSGYVAVKKDYLGNKLGFINEISALHHLRSTDCNIPTIMDINFKNLTLTVSYIFGSVLREELAKKAACLRDRDTVNPSFLSDLDKKKMWLGRIQEGNRFLHDVVDSQFIERLFEELKKIHKSGFIWNDLKYGNIIIEKKSGHPYLIDFDRTDHYSKLPKNIFRMLCDQEIEMFNLHFSTQKMTFDRIKKEIKKFQKEPIYSPVYFGAGLRMGDLWDINVGYGRWHYILKSSLPSFSGKRFLDLGANNAFYSIQMLRSGAREAIGIEINKKCIEQGKFIKKGFEWADKKTYNFKYIHANMKDIMKMDIGKFDMIMALCCIYYLDDEVIANLIQHISTITDVFVVQCNTDMDIGRSDPHTYVKSSIEYNHQLLTKNGFPFCQIIAPHKYSRPLIIARKKR